MKLYLLLVLIIIVIILIFYTKKTKHKKIYNNSLDNWLTKKLDKINKRYTYQKIKPENIIQKDFQNARELHEQENGIDAIKAYINIFDKYKNPYVLIDIADIFNYGSNNTEINKDIAIEYYNMFLNNTNSNTPTYYIQDVFDKLQLLDDYHINMISLFDLYYKEHDTNFNTFTNKHITQNNTENFTLPNNNIMNNNELYNDINTIAYAPIISDPQNVHDTKINNTIHEAIKKIQDNTPINYTITQVFASLSKDVNKDVMNYILNATETKHSIRLDELLLLVYNRYMYKNLSLDNLIISLNECIENDTVVCFTGVFNRIVDSLNIIDDEVTIKSRSLYRQEILDVSSKFSSENEALEGDELKSALRAELHSLYVNTGLLSQSELDSYLSIWIDYI